MKIKMKNLVCPFCGMAIPATDVTYKGHYLDFDQACDINEPILHVTSNKPAPVDKIDKNTIVLHIFRCIECEHESFIVNGIKGEVKGIYMPIYPKSWARKFPDYVPSAIRQDYEEAYSILNLSPKASATLSRRCLQGMIRDFWNISKANLFQEIDAIKDNVAPAVWKTLHSFRKLGNIGAHMKEDVNLIVDIDTTEAEKLLKLIELLIQDWYINSHEHEILLSEINAISESKESE